MSTIKEGPESTSDASKLMGELAAAAPEEGMDMNELFDRIGKEGLLLAAMLLTIPFLLPVSMPGMSLPFGTLIILIGISLMTGAPVRIPGRLGRLRLRRRQMHFIADKAGAPLRRLEAWSKPRMSGLTASRRLRAAHAAAIICSSAAMMLPLPLPLSNAIPAYSILCLSLGLLRRDGAMLLAGYGLMAAAFLYLAAVYAIAWAGVRAVWGV